MASETVIQKYQAEIDRLDEEHRDLERMWNQVPWFALFALLSPVVGALWGWGAGMVELMVTGALVGTRAYLVAVRQTENRWNRSKLVDDRGKLVDDLGEQQVEPSRAATPTRRVASRGQPLQRARPAA